MPKLLIADPSKIMRATLKESLPDEYELLMCDNGKTAIELLNTHRPDALIINLSLPAIDGLTVLLKADHKPPAVLALTNIVTTYICHKAHAAGVGYLMLLPCAVSTVISKIQEMLNAPSVPGI